MTCMLEDLTNNMVPVFSPKKMASKYDPWFQVLYSMYSSRQVNKAACNGMDASSGGSCIS